MFPAHTAAGDFVITIAGRVAPCRNRPFLCLEEFPARALHDLVTYCRDMFDLTVQTLPTLKLEPRARDARREQLVAEELIAFLQRSYPELAARSDAVLN